MTFEVEQEDELNALMEVVQEEMEVLVEQGHDPADVAGSVGLVLADFLVNSMGMETAQAVLRHMGGPLADDLPLILVDTDVVH